MRTVSMRLSDLDGGNKLIPIGFQGENEYTTVNIDCKKIFDQHPDAVPALAVTPPKGDSYPAVVVRDGDIVSWTVCDSDLIYEGSGAIQLTFVIDETVIGKTYKARTKVLGSIEPSGETPTPIQNWLTQAAAALQALPTEVASAVAALMGAMVGIGETLDPDDEVTVNYDPANNTLTIGVPHGRDGVDGHTPAITANKVGKVATLYVDGAAIVTISDGTDGDPTALIDDTSTALNRTWSAKKISDEQSSLMTEINSKADEPTGTKSAGKVYGLDSNLDPVWQTPSGGGTVDDALSPTSTNPVQNKVITGVLNDVTESFPNDAYTRGAYDAGWEQGAIGTDGSESSNSKRIRSDYLPIGEEILGSFQTGAGQEYWLRLYNGSKQFIGSGKVNSSGKITGTEAAPTAVSYSLDLDSALETIPHVKYARLVVKYPDNAAITPEDCKFDTTGKRGAFSGYSLEAIYKRKKKADYSASDLMFYYDVGNGYYTRGFLKLPSNYTTSDRPVPLVVFVHGSADVTSINATSMTENYNTYYNYIRDNGYAVFDCYAYGSKYPTQGVNTWGIPINNDCYEAGIRYVCEKYNIDIDNVFVSCKSQGGTQAFSMLMNPFMPIKAVGMLAPELWMLQMKFGYTASDRQTIATELGFSEDTGHVMDFTNGTDPVPEGFYDYITANMDKWCGYCANFAGLPITNANKPTYYTHPTSYQTGSMSRIGLNRPLKIWIASDDDAVSYDSADAVVKSFQNGGQIAQLRTMPANTGKHHAVDTDPNALQTTNVTTPLGVTYATIPTAYYELVRFFNQYLTK